LRNLLGEGRAQFATMLRSLADRQLVIALVVTGLPDLAGVAR
jgi:hypothetical protein